MAAKGDVPPKPPDDPDPNPPLPAVVAPSDPKPPDALAEEVPSAEKGDFSELEKAESPEDANAEVDVVEFSVGFSTDCPWLDGSAAVSFVGDVDEANAAKGEAVAVSAKPDVGLT